MHHTPPSQRTGSARAAVRPPSRRTLIVVLAAALLAAAVLWAGDTVIRTRLSPSARPQLALLRRVPHPSGAVEVAYRLENGTYRAKPTAWLTYRLTGPACPAALATFAATGVDQVGTQAGNEVAAYCQPPGTGFESFCIPAEVCFFADFISDHDVREYTISTGPDGEG